MLGGVLLLAPVYNLLSARSRATASADAAALAAADAAIGRTPGFPCDLAGLVAGANGVAVTDCQVDGVIVTVRVSIDILGFPVTATATAGPPARS